MTYQIPILNETYDMGANLGEKLRYPTRTERITLGLCVLSLTVIPFAVRDALRRQNALSRRTLRSFLRAR